MRFRKDLRTARSLRSAAQTLDRVFDLMDTTLEFSL